MNAPDTFVRLSQWGGHDRVAVEHRAKIGHIMPYLKIQWPGHVPWVLPPLQLGLRSINHSCENRQRVRISRVIEQHVQYMITRALCGAGTMLSCGL